MTINVALFVSSPVILEGLKIILAGEDDVQIIWCMGESVLPPKDAHVVVTYHRIQGVLADIKAPKVLLTHEDTLRHHEMLTYNINGVLPVEAPRIDILTAIRSVAVNKNIYLGRGITLTTPLENYELTPREKYIFFLLASGGSVKEVACNLNLSVKTVEAHKFNLMKKLGVHNRADLTRRAIRDGVIEA